MKKGFIQALVVFVAFAVLVIILIFGNSHLSNKNSGPSPSPDLFDSWKTYKNKTYGFSIRYPKEWYLKIYGDYGVDFWTINPALKEATPGAIAVRYSRLAEKIDQDEFERIFKSDPGATIYEPLDVRSVITKTKNLKIGENPTIDFTIDRTFSALEGPRTEFSHVYEINKNGQILRFISSAETKEEQKFRDSIFGQIISSIKF